MRIHVCAAAVASVATFALAPLAAAHGTWWRADADRGQSFAQMQAASSEAPAFHTGDGSIYDSSRGLETSTRIAAVPQPASPSTYKRRSMRSESLPPIDSAAQLDVAPADRSVSVLSNRPGVSTDRYGTPMK
jgi:hypothetical protein